MRMPENPAISGVTNMDLENEKTCDQDEQNIPSKLGTFPCLSALFHFIFCQFFGGGDQRRPLIGKNFIYYLLQQKI